MASLDPVKSQLVVYNPQAHPLAKAKAHMQKMQDVFMKKSFQGLKQAMRTVKALNGPVCECAERTSKMVDNIVMDKVLEK